MQLMSYPLLLLASLGHVALCVAWFNRIHAMGLPRRWIKVTEKVPMLIAVGVPAWWWPRLAGSGFPFNPAASLSAAYVVETGYVFACCAFLGYLLLVRCWRLWLQVNRVVCVSTTISTHDVQGELGQPLLSGTLAGLLCHVPRNQITSLAVTEKVFRPTGLDSQLDGLTIAHLSDLHMCRRVKRPFFEFVVERTNELRPDLIAITGDIIDKDACLDWIPSTLGQLRSRYGTYFVLGNHDKRLRDVSALRRLLGELGLIDLGGRSEVLRIGSSRLLLAGNECPWFPRLPTIPSLESGQSERPAFRLLLSHSPDQITWARRYQFDLMLAGHTHGGQIRLPVLGPLVAPSNFGVKYASGEFYEHPTLLHVTRGVSGLEPIRLNCPPELARIVLRRGLLENTFEQGASSDSLVLAAQAG